MTINNFCNDPQGQFNCEHENPSLVLKSLALALRQAVHIALQLIRSRYANDDGEARYWLFTPEGEQLPASAMDSYALITAAPLRNLAAAGHELDHCPPPNAPELSREVATAIAEWQDGLKEIDQRWRPAEKNYALSLRMAALRMLGERI